MTRAAADGEGRMRGGCMAGFLVGFAALFSCLGIALVSQGGTTNLIVGWSFFASVALLALLVLLARGSGRRLGGVRGEARVLAATETGLRINNRPVVRLRLRVQGPGIEPFETECQPAVPLIALARLAGPAPLPVWFDPNDHTKFDIDWTIGPPPDADQAPAAPDSEAGTAGRLRQLDELRASNLISADEHAAQRARILGEL